MKRFLIKIVLFAFVASVMVFNFNISMNSKHKMKFALENIEALSSIEDGGRWEGGE